jgi:hypothetical protein
VKLALFVPLFAVGLVSFVIVRSQQGEGATLVARQIYAAALTPSAVESVVRAAPDPVTGARGLRAGCTPLSSGELDNPWRCTITYRSGRVIQYRVTLDPSGSYTGDQEIVHFRGRTYPDTGHITGCCVVIP